MGADVPLPSVAVAVVVFVLVVDCIGSTRLANLPAVPYWSYAIDFWRFKQEDTKNSVKERASTSIAHPQVIRKVISISVCRITIFAGTCHLEDRCHS